MADGPRLAGVRPSVKDVAALAGVSLGTVSNVLNRPDLVSGPTRERVDAAMAELGFVRNESARQLRVGRSRTLAYVVLDARNPFFTDVASGVEAAGRPAGMSLMLCDSGQDVDRERSFLDLLQQQRVQAVLVTPVDPEAEHLTRVRDHGTPVVLVDRRRQDAAFCSASVDDVRGGRLALEHLVGLGHRRVALVGGTPDIGQVHDRWQGARAAWHDAGLDPADLVEVPTDRLDLTSGAGTADRVAAIPGARRPTAAFCANDLLGLGLLRGAVEAGFTVPDDLAVIGVDDIDFSAAAVVPLTSVRQPRTALGRAATALALEEAEDPRHEHRQLMFQPELVVRRSTTP